MQSKPTMRHHIGKNIKSDNAKYWSGCRVRGTHTLLVEVYSGTVTLERVWYFLVEYRSNTLRPHNVMARYML